MKVKELKIKPISGSIANNICKRIHYSGKVVPNSQLHFGVFYQNKCYGVMQFGPCMVKKAMIGLVEGTGWNDFLELNRMAFEECLPKNSESRCLGIALKLIRKHYPHIKWILTFADATQCGDGTIYRATGFKLLGIKKNSGLRVNPKTGEIIHTITAYHNNIRKEFNKWETLAGYQIKYIKIIDPDYENKLTVPILPYSKLNEMNARMYKGEKL